MNTRIIKVSYLTSLDNSEIPFLRIKGKWLRKDAGIYPGDKVLVTIAGIGHLTITKLKEEGNNHGSQTAGNGAVGGADRGLGGTLQSQTAKG